MQNSQLISSLAILKVNFDSGFDYIDNFIPFVLEALRSSGSPEASNLQIKSVVFGQFGLNIPLGALNIILRRCSDRNYLKRDRHTLVLSERSKEYENFSEIRASVLDQHRRIVRSLKEFVSRRFEQRWAEDDAEEALAAYLRDHGSPILSQSLVQDGGFGTKRSNYLVHAFVRHLHRRRSPDLSYLVTLVKGSMLASVLYFPNPADIKHSFKNVEVFLDTPLLIPALGLARSSLRSAAKELIEVTYAAGAQLRCFEETAEEVRRVLAFLSAHLGKRGDSSLGFHDALEYAHRHNLRRSDIELTIARLETILGELQIEIVPMPRHTVPTGVDENRFELVLQERLGYKRRSSLQHDLSALTAIHRLRGGQSVDNIDSCRAVFVTDNIPLVRASAELFDDYFDHVTVPHCISHHLLTTIAWLKNPLRVPDLPAHKLIADCYAAMNPSNRLWDLYIAEMGRLKERGDLSDEDYHLLRFSMTARNALMDVTMGDIGFFVEGTVEEVLRRSRAAIKEEVEQERIAEMERRLSAEQMAERAMRQLEESEVRQRHRVEYLSGRVGRYAAVTVTIVGCFLLAVAVYLSFPVPRPEVSKGWRSIALSVIIVCLVILGFMTVSNLVFGVTVKSISGKIEKLVAKRFASWLRRMAGEQ